MISKVKSGISSTAAIASAAICVFVLAALALVPPAHAEQANGDFGNGCHFTLDEQSNLEISAAGGNQSPSFSIEDLRNAVNSSIDGAWYSIRSFATADGERLAVQGNMSSMFADCSQLESADLSGLDTSSVEDMTFMFGNCYNLERVNAEGIDTSSVVYMSRMFYSCSSLETLDLSSFDTSKVVGMEVMFAGCEKLSELDMSGWDTSKAENMSAMFYQCSVLEKAGFSEFNTKHVKDMTSMFAYCTSLETIDLSGWDTSKVMYFPYMFCEAGAKTIYASNDFKISADASTYSMFDGAVNLVGGSGTEYDASHIDGEAATIDMRGGNAWGSSKGYFTGANHVHSAISNGSLNTTAPVLFGNAYEGTIVPYEQYKLPHEIEVVIEGTVVPSEAYYYNGATGEIFIPAGRVMSSVSIIVECEEIGTECTVTFDVGEYGVSIEPQTVKIGGKAIKPENPTAEEEYVFSGWYKDADFENIWDFDHDLVEGNMTLYAKWEPDTHIYTVVFDTCGHGIAPETQIVNYGDKVDMPDAPSDGNYIFDGWYRDPVCENIWNFEEDTITGPTTLYAKWNPVSHTVIFFDGFTGLLSIEIVEHSKAAPEPEEPSRTGCRFLGWSRDFSNIIDDTVVIALWDISIENATITAIPDQKWTGSPIEPSFEVTLDNKTLTEGKDYKTYYDDNVEPGLASVRIDGIGKYYGSKLSVFSIGESCNFVDVNWKTPHNTDINWLAATGISTGWQLSGGRYFEPTNYVLRADMAAFLYRTAGSPAFDETPAENPFNDVTPDTPHYKEILWCYCIGITTGYGAGADMRFEPFTPVYRQDMAAFLHRTEKAIRNGDDKQGANELDFEDVDEMTPHHEDIKWLSQSGITTGYHIDGKDYYIPTELVYRQDMAAFLHRLSVFSR